jgi:putative transposase
MIPLSQRQQIVQWVDEASTAGARRHKACELLGITARTLQRWQQSEGLGNDGRMDRAYEPQNKLSDPEREQVLAVANSAEFADLPPSQIVPIMTTRTRNRYSRR